MAASNARIRGRASPPRSLALDCSYANLLSHTNYCVGSPTFGLVDRAGNHSPKGDGRCSHGDLVGNLAEWMLDAYAAASPKPCDNCVNLTGTTRVLRGGGFGNSNQMIRVPFRGRHHTDDAQHRGGVALCTITVIDRPAPWRDAIRLRHHRRIEQREPARTMRARPVQSATSPRLRAR